MQLGAQSYSGFSRVNGVPSGNLIVYLRMKNIVPPSSEPGFTPEPKK